MHLLFKIFKILSNHPNGLTWNELRAEYCQLYGQMFLLDEVIFDKPHFKLFFDKNLVANTRQRQRGGKNLVENEKNYKYSIADPSKSTGKLVLVRCHSTSRSTPIGPKMINEVVQKTIRQVTKHQNTRKDRKKNKQRELKYNIQTKHLPLTGSSLHDDKWTFVICFVNAKIGDEFMKIITNSQYLEKFPRDLKHNTHWKGVNIGHLKTLIDELIPDSYFNDNINEIYGKSRNLSHIVSKQIFYPQSQQEQKNEYPSIASTSALISSPKPISQSPPSPPSQSTQTPMEQFPVSMQQYNMPQSQQPQLQLPVPQQQLMQLPDLNEIVEMHKQRREELEQLTGSRSSTSSSGDVVIDGETGRYDPKYVNNILCLDKGYVMENIWQLLSKYPDGLTKKQLRQLYHDSGYFDWHLDEKRASGEIETILGDDTFYNNIWAIKRKVLSETRYFAIPLSQLRENTVCLQCNTYVKYDQMLEYIKSLNFGKIVARTIFSGWRRKSCMLIHYEHKQSAKKLLIQGGYTNGLRLRSNINIRALQYLPPMEPEPQSAKLYNTAFSDCLVNLINNESENITNGISINEIFTKLSQSGELPQFVENERQLTRMLLDCYSIDTRLTQWPKESVWIESIAGGSGDGENDIIDDSRKSDNIFSNNIMFTTHRTRKRPTQGKSDESRSRQFSAIKKDCIEFFQNRKYENGVQLSEFSKLFHAQFGYVPYGSLVELLRKFNIFAVDFAGVNMKQIEKESQMESRMNRNYDLYLCKMDSRTETEINEFKYPLYGDNINGMIIDGFPISARSLDIQSLLCQTFGACIVRRRGAHRFAVWFDNPDNANRAIKALKNNEEGMFVIPPQSCNVVADNVLSWMDFNHVYNVY